MSQYLTPWEAALGFISAGRVLMKRAFCRLLLFKSHPYHGSRRGVVQSLMWSSGPGVLKQVCGYFSGGQRGVSGRGLFLRRCRHSERDAVCIPAVPEYSAVSPQRATHVSPSNSCSWGQRSQKWLQGAALQFQLNQWPEVSGPLVDGGGGPWLRREINLKVVGSFPGSFPGSFGTGCSGLLLVGSKIFSSNQCVAGFNFYIYGVGLNCWGTEPNQGNIKKNIIKWYLNRKINFPSTYFWV